MRANLFIFSRYRFANSLYLTVLMNKCRKKWYFLFLLLFTISCVDEKPVNQDEMVDLSIVLSKAGIPEPGDPEDRDLTTFRVLGFDDTGKCTVNHFYTKAASEPYYNVQFKIKAGNYRFIFLGNEPAEFRLILDMITLESDLETIFFPHTAFASDIAIPMIQDTDIAVYNDMNYTVTLDRLAIRVDLLLQSKLNMDEGGNFEGVTIKGIAGKVPLIQGSTYDYDPEQEYTIPRSDFTVVAEEDRTADMNWAMKYNRIILPSKNLFDVTEEDKAMFLYLNLKNEPDLFHPLKNEDHQFSFPGNTYLDVVGTIRDVKTLDLDMTAKPWSPNGDDWDLAKDRILNLSDTKVSITDLNGARITFWSNMPVVRVLPQATVRKNGGAPETMKTNNLLNAIAFFKHWDQDHAEHWSTQRYYYDKESGYGYMDILTGHYFLDQTDYIHDPGIYEIEFTIVASDEEYYDPNNNEVDLGGKNRLMKTIKVEVYREGKSYIYTTVKDLELEWNNDTGQEEPIYENGLYKRHSYATGYVGAFFNDNETGERIITGYLNGWYGEGWRAEVEDGADWIIISSSPSLDPYVGTTNPGNPENYPVIPNGFKNENGRYVAGEGRVYFRVGARTVNPSSQPRYGTIRVVRENVNFPGVGEKRPEQIFYVRQGSAPDKLRGDAAFSIYNLTTQEFKSGSSAESVPITNPGNQATNIIEVDYPTQGGAHFQWGRFENQWTNPLNVAYNSAIAREETGINGWPDRHLYEFPFWGAPGPQNPTLIAGDYFEICPPGYHRPSDGPADRISLATEADIALSEWRTSIMPEPKTGDGEYLTVDRPIDPANKPEKYDIDREIQDGIVYGFYADGFFDRRPIQSELIEYPDYNMGAHEAMGVDMYETTAAYRGVLFTNGSKSIFFPAAGQRNARFNGRLDFHSETGYYWTTTVSPGWMSDQNEEDRINNAIYSMHLSYWDLKPLSCGFAEGRSIRCVKDYENGK